MKRSSGFVFLCFALMAGQATAASISAHLTNPSTNNISEKRPSSKNAEDSFVVRTNKIEGNVYFLECINGFGGGNVAASVGEDGILIVDDMYNMMSNRLKAALKKLSDQPIKMVLNTHFHGDHIDGNKSFQKSSVIIAQENVGKRLLRTNSEKYPTAGMMPAISFRDSLTIHFNGEDIKLIHYPNSHTDGDAMIYFTKSKVIHLGDMFFFKMFPAVYTEGGGNIKQLIVSLDQVLKDIPADTHVVPGHGDVATMQDLQEYVNMLKETTGIMEECIRKGISLEQMKKEKVLAKYNALGDGGAQTTDEYLAMLYKLLSANKS